MKTAYSSVLMIAFSLSAFAGGIQRVSDVIPPCPGGYVKNGECIGGRQSEQRQCGDERFVLDQLGCLNADGSTSDHCRVVHGKESCPYAQAFSCKGFAVCTDFSTSAVSTDGPKPRINEAGNVVY